MPQMLTSSERKEAAEATNAVGSHLCGADRAVLHSEEEPVVLLGLSGADAVPVRHGGVRTLTRSGQCALWSVMEYSTPTILTILNLNQLDNRGTEKSISMLRIDAIPSPKPVRF
jgi:hypothetical protein